MLYRNKFSERKDVQKLVAAINLSDVKDVNIMEVCGTHTMSIAASGIKQMLPVGIKMISGPGCPVCVTPSERIDDIYNLSKNRNVIIATYGDMLRVPGTIKDISLDKSRMEGADIRMVYSSVDALNIAKNNPMKEIVFLGIGFETTAPASAAVINEAMEKDINNFSVFCLHKQVEPVLRALLDSGEVKVDGFLLPGHVAVILGEKDFEFLAEEYGIPGVIAGFEPGDILKAIYMILNQIEYGYNKIENEYTRLVSIEGNIIAKQIMKEVFTSHDDIWRGLGMIKSSGMKIKKEYCKYDAVVKFGIECTPESKNIQCKCGEILKGLIQPAECKLFDSGCSPDSPVGPCMVSSEGTCAAAYKYR